jgi:hypothetical protein
LLLCVIAPNLPCQVLRAGARRPPFLGPLAAFSVQQRHLWGRTF